jgi:RHS repeat-associated protein
VTTAYDLAGRPASVQNGTTLANYANPVSYAPNGSVNSITLGNSLIETTTFNTRFQPTQIQASNSLLTLGYGYGTTNNNGNIQSQSVYDGATTRNQSFSYDGVNRLTGASEGANWTQTYVYDTYGNRGLYNGSSDPSTGTSLAMDVVTTSLSTVPFNASNHWTAATTSYDSRGNLTAASASTNSLGATFDAENRQIQSVSTVGGNTTTVNYGYDGNGQRVSKAISGGATTTYVYDALGHLAAEYSTATNPDSGTQYLTDDPLGSTRLITTGTTSPSFFSRSDYLPFGQEIPTSWGSRTAYAPDPSETLKFTGKERDQETGLDFFEARYFSSAQGRFTSADEFKGGIVDPFTGLDVETNTALPYADITDPQTLNKYGYVRNSPLRYVDPDGHGLSDAIQETINGAISATLEDNGVSPLVDAPQNSLGRGIGHGIALAQGLAEEITGGGAAIGGVAGAPETAGATLVVTAGGVALAAHGAAVQLNTLRNIQKGPSASASPGTAASGQATDENGRKLGPSGRVVIHQVETPGGRGVDAKRAAKAAGHGEPVQHNNPRKGKPHYHPVDRNGKKIEDGTHYNYDH